VSPRRPDQRPTAAPDDEPGSERGWVEPGLAAELPGVGLRYSVVDGGPTRTPARVRHRLRALSDRFAGPQAIHLRHQAIPWAYRVFFRHIGLDPDEQRTPVERLALERMFHGGFPSRNLLDDALAIAIVESGVALRAFDAERLSGAPGIRQAGLGDELGGRDLAPGTLVLADERRPLDLLFGETAGSPCEPTRRTRRALIAAIGVRGVPDIALEEAIWLAASVIRS
jgi:DNA/RNA-binding domain of Phe-tRNA-synthetase-like protein